MLPHVLTQAPPIKFWRAPSMFSTPVRNTDTFIFQKLLFQRNCFFKVNGRCFAELSFVVFNKQLKWNQATPSCSVASVFKVWCNICFETLMFLKTWYFLYIFNYKNIGLKHIGLVWKLTLHTSKVLFCKERTTLIWESIVFWKESFISVKKVWYFHASLINRKKVKNSLTVVHRF